MSKMKCLWAVALVTLCVTLFAGAAFAQVGWTPTADTLPSALVWGQGADVSITADNTGVGNADNWNDTFSIESVEGSGAEATAIDRWGTSSVPVVGNVAYSRPAPRLTGTYRWDFHVTAPPISALSYGAAPVTPTAAPVVGDFDCNWALAKDGTIFSTLATVDQPVNVVRFSDIAKGTAGEWAAGYVTECAGRVPLLVGGYPDGTYQPNTNVTRAQMAVFMQRAMNLTMVSYTGGFSDVPSDYWAKDQIQTLVDNNIVQGYGGGIYGPEIIVNRGQMAIFVARGLTGGIGHVPSGPTTATFNDVPVGHWAYNEVEYAKAAGVVQGYDPVTYAPDTNVNRGQMAVFIWRAFIKPTSSAVVLAGPAVTAVDTEAAGYQGWSVAASGEAAAPGTAYVALDATRLSGDVDVTLGLYDPADVNADGTLKTGAVAVDEYTETVDGAAAAAAAVASGDVLTYVYWTLPTDLAEDTYKLVAKVNGSVFTGYEQTFRVGAPIEPAAPVTIVSTPDVMQTPSYGSLASGTVADVVADDTSYVQLQSDSVGKIGCVWEVPVALTPAQIKKIELEGVARTNKALDPDLGGQTLNFNTSGSSGSTRYIADGDFTVADVDSVVSWNTANINKIADMFKTSSTGTLTGRVWIYTCGGCTDGMAGAVNDWIMSVDEIKVTFTER